MKSKYLIGIDEAGRGPLAGPVAVGVVCVASDFNWGVIPGITDSKKLLPKKREELFLKAQKLKDEGLLFCAVSMVSAQKIDENGIVFAINNAMRTGLRKVKTQSTYAPHECRVLLDGSLRAPKEYTDQETIIKGDAKEKVIGLASILAKVTRDRYMVRISRKESYKEYQFHLHKGYGTKTHRDRIAAMGASDVHRMSFCRNCLNDEKVV